MVIGAVFNVILIWVLDMKMMTQFFLVGRISFFHGEKNLMIARFESPFHSVDGVRWA